MKTTPDLSEKFSENKSKTGCCRRRLFSDIPLDDPKTSISNVAYPHGGQRHSFLLTISTALRFTGMIFCLMAILYVWIIFPFVEKGPDFEKYGVSRWTFAKATFFYLTQLNIYLSLAYWIMSFFVSVKREQQTRLSVEREGNHLQGVSLQREDRDVEHLSAKKNSMKKENSATVLSPPQQASTFSCTLTLFRELYMVQTLLIFIEFWGLLYASQNYESDWQECFVHGFIMVLWAPEILLHRHTFNWFRFLAFFMPWLVIYGLWNLLGSYLTGNNLYYSTMPWFSFPEHNQKGNPGKAVIFLAIIAVVLSLFYGLLQLVKRSQKELVADGEADAEEENMLMGDSEVFVNLHHSGGGCDTVGDIEAGSFRIDGSFRNAFERRDGCEIAEGSVPPRSNAVVYGEIGILETRRQKSDTVPVIFYGETKGAAAGYDRECEESQNGQIGQPHRRQSGIRKHKKSKWIVRLLISLFLLLLYVFPFIMLFRTINTASTRVHSLEMALLKGGAQNELAQGMTLAEIEKLPGGVRMSQVDIASQKQKCLKAGQQLADCKFKWAA